MLSPFVGSSLSRGIGMTDEQLLLNAALAEKNGDAAEHDKYTATIIAEYIPLIKAKASHFKSNLLENDDLVSEGFLGLLSAIRAYNPQKGAFAAFASACITNRMRSAAAKAASGHLTYLSPDEFHVEEIQDEQPGAEDILIEKEQNHEIMRNIGKLLSQRERQVFSLYLSAYSYVQIAQKLGISVKSVDNALTRAKAKLRKSMFNEKNKK